MTYHERELLVSRSSPRRTFNNRWCSSRLSSSPSLRIECKAEERHFLGNISPYTINSFLKPIRYTMTEQIKPTKFRSEIVVHNNSETDLHIKRLRVNFRCPDDAFVDGTENQHSLSIPTARSQSVHIPHSSFTHEQRVHTPKRKCRPAILAQPQVLLRKWIDDLCANEQLMSNDDIVFFIKNGEFFARI